MAKHQKFPPRSGKMDMNLNLFLRLTRRKIIFETEKSLFEFFVMLNGILYGKFIVPPDFFK